MATAAGLTNAAERRVRLIAAIRSSLEQRGYPPTAAELADDEGVHRTQVQADLKVLEQTGDVIVEHGVPRGLRLPRHRIIVVPIEDKP